MEIAEANKQELNANEHSRSIPPVVLTLLVVNIAIYFAEKRFQDGLNIDFGLWPLGDHVYRRSLVGFQPWQLLTYGFLHGSNAHLFFNMFGLFMFGGLLEKVWGKRRFLLYYIVTIMGAGLIQLVVCTIAASSGKVYPTIGASGGVMGVLLAFGMMFPRAPIYLIFVPVPIRALQFVVAYGILELIMGVSGTESGIAHFAHLGGMIFGFLLIQNWRQAWPWKKKP